MAYASIDVLQQLLAETVFGYAADKKKAAGRALGTLVELITFYTLRAWEFRDSMAIERSLPEFANRDISHNVEFSLHPLLNQARVTVAPITLPVTTAKLLKKSPDLEKALGLSKSKVNELLSTKGVMRNACVLSDDGTNLFVAHVDLWDGNKCELSLSHLHVHPYAIFECKRVGVEEGMKKGPQTIEKAKQGAYVARSVSSLQQLRRKSGQVDGIIESKDGALRVAKYTELLSEVIHGKETDLLAGFILTVGIVSNHGNWFTSENQNKELKVLSQSYDWLLFLTDSGLAQFIDRLLLNPVAELAPAKAAFASSYTGETGANSFTKVRIGLEADAALKQYFLTHESEVESWFNVISPKGATIRGLRDQLQALRSKNWKEILNP